MLLIDSKVKFVRRRFITFLDHCCVASLSSVIHAFVLLLLGKRERATRISEAMKNLSIVTASDDSPFITDTTGSSSDSSSSLDNQTLRRLKLNEFLDVCGKETVNQHKKSWGQLSSRTKNGRISKAKDAVVASPKVISPQELTVSGESPLHANPNFSG